MADNSLGAKVGSPVVVPVIGEWTSYTPTFTGFGTPTAVTFSSRRVGTCLEVQGIFTGGSSTGVEARVSIALGTTSLTVDSTPISSGSNSVVGSGSFSVASALDLQILATGGQAYLKFGLQSASDAGLTVKVGNTLLSSGQSISFFARVPILEWAGSASVAYGAGLATSAKAGLVDPYQSSGVVASGTYTPTFTNTSNVASSSPGLCSWLRVGKMVMVNGGGTCATTAAANTYTELGISLPIASDLALSTDLSGVGGRDAASGGTLTVALLSANVANDRAYFTFNSSDTTNRGFNFQFMYIIK